MAQIRQTEEQKQEIIRLYNSGINVPEISRIVDKKECTVKAVLYARKVPLRTRSQCRQKYKINENFFDNPNQEKVAYILGLLYADGSNYRPSNCVKLDLQYRDKELLEKITELIQPDKPLGITKLSKSDNNLQDICLFRITNKKISERLEELGCGQAKTFTIKFPEYINDENVKHFIRGYFDGDGYLSKINPNSSPSIEIVAMKSILDWMCNKIKEQLNLDPNVRQHQITKGLYGLRLWGKKKTIPFLNYIYQDATIYLERKYQRYQDILNYKKNK